MIQNMNQKKICEHVKEKLQINDLTNEKMNNMDCKIDALHAQMQASRDRSEERHDNHTCKIDELILKLDKMEQLLNEHNESIIKFKSSEFITVQQLEEVVDDVKLSFESILNLTPRNTDDITLILNRIEQLENKFINFEENMNINVHNLNVKNSDRDFQEKHKIPKINLAFRERKIKNNDTNK